MLSETFNYFGVECGREPICIEMEFRVGIVIGDFKSSFRQSA
jgi:hypothetical protein